MEHREELTALVEEAFADVTAAEAISRLDEAGIANARLRTMDEFAAHPQLAARDRWRQVDSPVGPLDALLPPVTVAEREPRMAAVPALGEHTAAVLAEFAPPTDDPVP